VLTWSGLGGRPVTLGPLDPARWFPGRGLTLAELPLVAMLLLGGIPLVWDLLTKLFAGTFSSDLLAGISIVMSILIGEYLAGVLVVLMLSGGEALEQRAVSRAGDVLAALARGKRCQGKRCQPPNLGGLPDCLVLVAGTFSSNYNSDVTFDVQAGGTEKADFSIPAK